MSASADRRLPVYLLLDCSGSMAGEPITALQMGVQSLVADLCADPYALETVWLSVVTFGSHADQLVPLTEVDQFALPILEAGGSTALGDALEVLAERIEAEVRNTSAEQKGDWRPMAFLFTDGEPTDHWRPVLARLRESSRVRLIACGAGPEVNDATLAELSPEVVRLTNTQPGTLGAFLKWVTASVTTASRSLGADGQEITLPPPPGPTENPLVIPAS